MVCLYAFRRLNYIHVHVSDAMPIGRIMHFRAMQHADASTV